MRASISSVFAFHLFRGHVLQSAEDHALGRDGFGDGRKLGKRRGWCGLLPQLGQAEVQQLRAGFREHDVARLQIAVSDALAMRLVERVGNFYRVLQDLLDRQRTFLQSLRERFAFQVFHHQKINFVLMSCVVERADVGMIQAGDGFCFAVESLAQIRAVGEMSGQNFYRDNSVEAGIAGPVHLAHSARTDSGENFVWP